MKSDSRLSLCLHAVLVLAQSASTPVTSETLGRALTTNPVVVRRTMGLLRKAGIVAAGRGPSGGWWLAAPPEQISLLRLHQALGDPALVGLGLRPEGCRVDRVVNAALTPAVAAAEALLRQQFSRITLADLAADLAASATAPPRP